jgi:cystathionine beta-lyase family protein involved in aluminum resistance
MTKAEFLELARKEEAKLQPQFARIDEISQINTERVLDSFASHRVSEAMFAPSSGYGYDDRGREALDEIYADVLGCESAFVRHSIANGTHALALALFGLLRPNDVMLSITGKPYDTLEDVIGMHGAKGDGSLADFGVTYRELDFLSGSTEADVINALKDPSVKVVFLQRSKGYLNRRTLSPDEISAWTELVHAHSNAFVVVDNCYGEFTDTKEPKADLLVGSLIKNPGGGMAESGAYIAGTKKAVELVSYRFTCPGLGLEVGATLGQNKNMFKGFFYAPHTVAQAVKTAVFAAAIFSALGYTVSPRADEARYDIIQMIQCQTPENLCAFCRGIQSASPVDAYVTPEPWAMPGYADPVIMAAGAFTQGSSIELSADGPLRPPYTAYLQGGLTYESGRLGILRAAMSLLKIP